MSTAPRQKGICAIISASQTGITAFKELKTQYMQAVFQMKKQRIAMRQTNRPFLFSFD
jgi:hypothetical protein